MVREAGGPVDRGLTLTSEVSGLCRKTGEPGGLVRPRITTAERKRHVAEVGGESETITEVIAWMKSKLVRITAAVGSLATLIVAGSAGVRIG